MIYFLKKLTLSALFKDYDRHIHDKIPNSKENVVVIMRAAIISSSNAKITITILGIIE